MSARLCHNMADIVLGPSYKTLVSWQIYSLGEGVNESLLLELSVTLVVPVLVDLGLVLAVVDGVPHLVRSLTRGDGPCTETLGVW